MHDKSCKICTGPTITCCKAISKLPRKSKETHGEVSLMVAGMRQTKRVNCLGVQSIIRIISTLPDFQVILLYELLNLEVSKHANPLTYSHM
jgi:hypothetical protein